MRATQALGQPTSDAAGTAGRFTVPAVFGKATSTTVRIYKQSQSIP